MAIQLIVVEKFHSNTQMHQREAHGETRGTIQSRIFRVHPQGNTNVYTQTHNCGPCGGTTGKIRETPESLGFILRGT